MPIIKDILQRYADIIQFEYDEDKDPVCNESLIRFNGIDEDGHETFIFSNEAEKFSFCKTARKPYDIVVCECLIVLNHFIPELEVSSDGMYGYVSREEEDLKGDYFVTDSIAKYPEKGWDDAMFNVSDKYGINYSPICVDIRSDRQYYDWELQQDKE